jgi:hypothetical protein
MKRWSVLVTGILLLLASASVFSMTVHSKKNGMWGSNGNWVERVPQAGDDVIIQNGDALQLNVDTPALNSLTIESGGTVTNNGEAHILRIIGNFDNSGTFTPGTYITVVFTGSGRQYVSGVGTFYRLRVMNSAVLHIMSDITVNDSLAVINGGTLHGCTHIITLASTTAGNSFVLSSGTFTADTSTVSYTGSAAQSIPAATFYNLTIAAGTQSMSGTTIVNNTLTLSGGTMSIGANSLYLYGSVAYNGGTLSGGNTSNLYVMDMGSSELSLSVSNGLKNLVMDRAAGVRLAADLTITGVTNFSQGSIRLDSYNLSFGTAATFVGTLDSLRMLVTDGTGEVRKLVSANGSFTLPLGDETGSTYDYSPLTVNFSSGTYASGAYVGARAVGSKSPNHSDSSNYLLRYWPVTQSGITSFSCSLTGKYVDTDVYGKESEMTSSYWVSNMWRYFALANAGTNEVQAISVSKMGDLTGKIDKYGTIESIEDGEWNTIGTWNKLHLPLSSDSVVIRHSVTMNTSPTCKGLLIDSGTLANAGTTQTLSIAGGFTNNGTLDAGDYITVSMIGREGGGTPVDTVYAIYGTDPNFYVLNIRDTTVLYSDITIRNQLNVNTGAVLDGRSNSITLTGTGSTPFNVTGRFRAATSTVNYAAEADQVISPQEYYNLTATSTGSTTKRAGGRTTVGGVFTIGPATTFNMGTQTLVLTGSGATPLVINGVFNADTSTIRYAGSGEQNVVPIDYYNLSISRPDGSTTRAYKHLSASTTVYGSVVIDTASTLDVNGYTLNVQKNYTATQAGSNCGQPMFRSGGTLRFFGSGNSIAIGNNCTGLSSTLSGYATDCYNLVLEKNSATDTLYIGAIGTSNALFGIRDSGSVTLTRGVLNMQANYMFAYREEASNPSQPNKGTLTVSSEGTICVSGYDNFPLNARSSNSPSNKRRFFGTYNLESGSNIVYNKLGPQLVRSQAAASTALQYSNLRLAGSGKKSLSSNDSTYTAINTIINDTLTLSSGCTFGRMTGSMGTPSLRYAGTGVLQYRHNDSPALQSIQYVTDSEFVSGTYAPPNLSIFNKKDVKMQASKSLSGVMSFVQGKFILGTHDLTLTSTSYPFIGEDTARYIVCDTSNCVSTNNPGWLSLACVNTSTFTKFPIGTIYSLSGSVWGVDTVCNNIEIKTLQTATTIRARVSRFITRPLANPEILIYREWSVEETGSASNDAEVICMWNKVDEGDEFVRLNAQLITYHNTGQDVYQVPSASGTWPIMDFVGPWWVQGRLDQPANKTKFKNNLRINVGSSGQWPVELTSFAASAKDDMVHIAWRTASEYNNAGFDIERSWNGSEWERIARVDGQGTKLTPTDYAYIDKMNVSWHPDVVFYRLRQIDVSGTSTLSGRLAVQMSGSPESACILDVFPNPAASGATLVISLPEESPVTVTVHDALGREVARLANGGVFKAGTHLLHADAANLPAGLYYVSMQHQKGREIKKIIVAK